MHQPTECARCGDTRGVIQVDLPGIASGMCLPCFGALHGAVDALGTQFLQHASDATLLAVKDVSDQKDALDAAASAWLTSEVLFYYLHLSDRDAFASLDDRLRILFSRFLADTALVTLITSWGIGKSDPRYNQTFQMVRNGLNSMQLECGRAPPTDVSGVFRDTLSRLLAKKAPSAHAALAAATVRRASDSWRHIAPAVQVAIAATRPPSSEVPMRGRPVPAVMRGLIAGRWEDFNAEGRFGTVTEDRVRQAIASYEQAEAPRDEFTGTIHAICDEMTSTWDKTWKAAGLLADAATGPCPPSPPAAEARPPVPSSSQAAVPSDNILVRVWRGDLPLPVTYWIWGIALNAGLTLFFALLEAPGPLLKVLGLAYYVFIVVAIWRSSENYHGPKIWGALARISVILGAVRTVLGLVGALG